MNQNPKNTNANENDNWIVIESKPISEEQIVLNNEDERVYSTYVDLSPLSSVRNYLDLDSFRNFIENFYGNIPDVDGMLDGSLDDKVIEDIIDDLKGNFECGTCFQYVAISTVDNLSEHITNAKRELSLNDIDYCENMYEYCKIGNYYIFGIFYQTDWEQ